MKYSYESKVSFYTNMILDKTSQDYIRHLIGKMIYKAEKLQAEINNIENQIDNLLKIVKDPNACEDYISQKLRNLEKTQNWNQTISKQIQEKKP